MRHHSSRERGRHGRYRATYKRKALQEWRGVSADLSRRPRRRDLWLASAQRQGNLCFDGVSCQAGADQELKVLLVWAGMLDLVFKLAALVTVYAKPIPSAHQAVLLPWGGDIKAWLRDGVFDWNARITGARGPMRSPLLALPLLKFRYRQCSGDSASSFPGRVASGECLPWAFLPAAFDLEPGTGTWNKWSRT